MAVFTAAATALVGAVFATGTILGSATLYTLAVGVVAAGLAVGTARLFGVYNSPRGIGRDPGVKVQLPPATDNKVPRLYGTNYAGGIIVDAELKNQNQTMAYCLVLSEFSPGDQWSVQDIYRGDAKLNFAGADADRYRVVSQTDANGATDTDVDGLIRVRVYAGGSSAQHQIFPVQTSGNQRTAYNTGTQTDTAQMLRWDSNNTMENLVFAIFEIDYAPEQNIVGLDNIQFLLNNNVRNPADVLEDYLFNPVWGARLNSSDVDLDSIQAWREYCDEMVDYTAANGTTQTHARWRTDGALSTFNNVNENINKICISGSAWFTYNSKQGKFGVVVNRKATNTEKQQAFPVNDNNIVGEIKITGTELFQLYNSLEIEFQSVAQRDQLDVFYADIDAGLRNPNEPDNALKYQIDLVNSRPRVGNLGIQDLNQSRISTVLDVTLDFSGLQLDVGDLISVSSDLYGYSNRLFRVIRLEEREAADGVITVKLFGLEYLDAVYDDLLLPEDLPTPVTGITNFWSTPELRNINNTTITRGVVSAIDLDPVEYDGIFPPTTVVGLPQLSSDFSNTANTVNTLQTVTLPQLDSDLANTANAVNTLQTVTLPNLDAELSNLQIELNELEFELGNLVITETQIADDSISTPKLRANAVTAAKIQAGTITALQIAANTITGNNILANTITGNNILANTITGNNILANTITSAEIAANTITANNILANSITGDRIQAATSITAPIINGGQLNLTANSKIISQSAGSDLILWFGPESTPVNERSKSNGDFWIASDGTYRSNVRRRSSIGLENIVSDDWVEISINLPSVRGTAEVTGTLTGLAGADIGEDTITNLVIEVELRQGTTVLATRIIPVPTQGVSFDQSFAIDSTFFNSTVTTNRTSANYGDSIQYNLRARLQGSDLSTDTTGVVEMSLIGTEIAEV